MGPFALITDLTVPMGVHQRRPSDLEKTDAIAAKVLREMLEDALGIFANKSAITCVGLNKRA